jgi:hypothetical protein
MSRGGGEPTENRKYCTQPVTELIKPLFAENSLEGLSHKRRCILPSFFTSTYRKSVEANYETDSGLISTNAKETVWQHF